VYHAQADRQTDHFFTKIAKDLQETGNLEMEGLIKSFVHSGIKAELPLKAVKTKKLRGG